MFQRRLLASLVASRKACGVRQVELAERLAKPQSYISKVERGERGLDVCEYVAWMHAIGLNPSALLAILLDPDEDEEDDDDWHYVLQRLGAKPVSD